MSNFARLAAPLNKQLHKEQPVRCRSLDEAGLFRGNTIKATVVKPPILALPIANVQLIFDTDASEVQIGWVLLQKQHHNCSQHKRPPQLLLPSKTLDFVALDILGPLPKAKSRIQYVVVVTYRYSKLTRVISSSKTASTHIANTFLDLRIIPYRIPLFIFIINDLQFVSEFIATLCQLLGVKHLMTTMYDPQTNGQAERIKEAVTARL